ncbi:type II toxin-antitoxin system RelE/ParE family toxin [Flavobacterium sp.]|uniref:type II toxin-antitoxin system RelE/ParE family toxin n=1 Tax=Flavobacterium sp. TaxID=239 RepID=UPI003919F359
MTYKIIISRLASTEIKDSIDFYENRQNGLGIQFFRYLQGYINVLKTNPEFFGIKKEPCFRELSLKKFPFVVIYEIQNNDVIIYSVFNTNRNPEKKP